jgi:membrane associated rhomboid family serine protease
MPRLSSELRLGPLRVPLVVVLILLATTLASIAAASRAGFAVAVGGVLWVPAVLHGQLWRLVTFVLFEKDAPPLLFAALALYWVGRDLAKIWGARRFLLVYAALAAAAGVLTTLVGLLWPAVATIPHGGSWIVIDGLIVAWGLIHPRGRIRLFGVLPIEGRHLVVMTLAGTLLYALFRGLPLYVPHFASELAVLAWFGPLRRLRKHVAQRREAKRKGWSFADWIARENRQRRR